MQRHMSTLHPNHEDEDFTGLDAAGEDAGTLAKTVAVNTIFVLDNFVLKSNNILYHFCSAEYKSTSLILIKMDFSL